MRRLVALFALAAISISFPSCAAKKPADAFRLPGNYTLAFEDDFHGKLNTDVWEVAPFGPRKGGYWAPEQAYTENGNLIISTDYRDAAGSAGYYTACVNLKNRYSTYGYYEIRCKIDDVRGAWSAFWLMPDDISKTEQKAQDGCEIDIFETAVNNRIQNTLHYDNYRSSHKKITKVNNLYDGFHTFALDWKKDSLTFYYDNQPLWSVTDPDKISHYPANLIVSTEINGRYQDGDAAPVPGRWFWLGCGSIKDKNNTLPSSFVIDYIRVYDNGQLIWSQKGE